MHFKTSTNEATHSKTKEELIKKRGHIYNPLGTKSFTQATASVMRMLLSNKKHFINI